MLRVGGKHISEKDSDIALLIEKDLCLCSSGIVFIGGNGLIGWVQSRAGRKTGLHLKFHNSVT